MYDSFLGGVVSARAAKSLPPLLDCWCTPQPAVCHMWWLDLARFWHAHQTFKSLMRYCSWDFLFCRCFQFSLCGPLRPVRCANPVNGIQPDAAGRTFDWKVCAFHIKRIQQVPSVFCSLPVCLCIGVIRKTRGMVSTWLPAEFVGHVDFRWVEGNIIAS